MIRLNKSLPTLFLGKVSKILSINATVCCPQADSEICDRWKSGCGQVAVPLPAQRRSAYGERNADVPPGRALGDLYRLGSEVVKVVKEAFIFGHSVAEKVP